MGNSSDSSAHITKWLKIGCLVTLILFSVTSLLHYILHPNDRNRCSSLLNEGWWAVDQTWQPSSCMMHRYKPTEIATCLSRPSYTENDFYYSTIQQGSSGRRRRVVYIGDSIVRQQYFALLQLIRPDVNLEGDAHTNRKYIFHEEQLELEFWWDPFLNDTFIDMVMKERQQRKQQQQSGNKSSLMVVGGGAWHMRYLSKDDYFNAWRSSMDLLFDTVQKTDDNIISIEGGLTDALVLIPVEMPDYDRLDQNRSASITVNKVNRMNDYLHTKFLNIELTHSNRMPFQIPFVWNIMATTQLENNVTEDGLHYNTFITHAQTQVALNYRCNDQLDKTFPMANTCCYNYPRPRWYQLAFIMYYLKWIPIGFLFLTATVASSSSASSDNTSNSSNTSTLSKITSRIFPARKVLHSSFIFGLCIIYMYYSDRTHLFGKLNKHYNTTSFTSLMVATAVLGMIKLHHTSPLEKDEGFLNRHQTDEWKGWMQIIILVYHFLGASSISGIYNAVRILVAAYLFQTGYGHFTFFYKKQDFGLKRVLNVMVRLNYLTFVLQYVMDTDYLSYYFTPLVSFWFLVIWITMYVGHAWNKNTWFMLAKLAVACTLTTCFIKLPGVMEWTFSMLQFIFNAKWNAAEWRFRLGLDAYIVYAGMLCAFGYIKLMTEHKEVMESARWRFIKLSTLSISVMAMVWYFWYEITRENKFVYNVTHPYISWIPIMAFVFLRNATVYLRNTHSELFAFVGKISLETFIGQFHMWLAGDTKGLLVILPPSWLEHTVSSGWWINFALSSAVFVYVCYYMHQATQDISSWICHFMTSQQSAQNSAQVNGAAGEMNGDYQSVPLLPTNMAQANADASTPANSSSREEQLDTKALLTKNSKDEENGEQDEEDEELEQELETWNSFTTEKRRGKLSRLFNLKSMNRMIHDTRFKVVFFFIFVAVFNHLC